MNLEKLNSFDIFGQKALNIELLKSQGYNNISYLLHTKDDKFVLRVFKSNQSVNISRKFEFKVQKKAYKIGFAPKPIFLNSEFMVYEYLKGVHKTNLSKIDIKNLAKIIKKLHSIKLSSKPYNLKQDFLDYEKKLTNKDSIDILNRSKKALKKLKKYKKELVLSHFDLNPKNILFTQKNKIKIIDWEYSGTNDRFFDLSAICIEFKLSKKEERLFLKNYFSKVKKSYFKKLKLYKTLYKNICTLWFNTTNI